MRSGRPLLIYTVVVFAGGALIAPWLYWLVQSIAPNSHLAQAPFHRYEDRALLIMALAGIWPLLRSLGATSTRDVGLVNPRGQWKNLACGFALGFGSLAVVVAVTLAAHARQINSDLTGGKIAGKILGAALAAAAVAPLEELLFRGAIFGALRRTWNFSGALFVSSMIYAIVHFLAKSDLPGPVTWTSGFRLLPLKLAGFADLQVLIPGFFNLTLAGVLLALAYHRTGNLYFSMGLHAGWIFWPKAYNVFTTPNASANTWLWGTNKLVDGWFALVVLVLTMIVLFKLLPTKTPGSALPLLKEEDCGERKGSAI